MDTRTKIFLAVMGALALVFTGLIGASYFTPEAEAERALKGCFGSKGLEWGTHEHRATQAAKFAVWQYKGTEQENRVLSEVMCGNEGDLGFAVVTDYQKALSAPMTATQDFVPVTSLELRDGTTLAMSNLGDQVFLTLEPGATKEEIVVCTGISASVNRFTGCTRGLAFQGSAETAVAANQKTHSSGATVVISNVHYVYNKYFDKTTTSTQTVSSTIVVFQGYPRASSTTAVPSSNADYVTAYYANTLVAGGFSNLNVDTARGLSPTGGSPEQVGINLSTNRFNGLEFEQGASTSIRPLLSRTNIVWTTSTAAVELTQFRAVVASTTGQIYHSDTAFTSSTFKFVGFVVSSTNAGQTVYIAAPGSMLCGFSGLSPGANYFLNGVQGQISTTPPGSGTGFFARVGLALNATCLQVVAPKYVLTGGVTISNTTPQIITTNFYPARVTLYAGRSAASGIRHSISIGGDFIDNNVLTILTNASSTNADSWDASQNWQLYNNPGAGANQGQITGKTANSFTLTPINADFSIEIGYVAESE